jgi:hypothetical protein
MLIIAFSCLLFVGLAFAASPGPTPLTVTAWTDKQQYSPGDKGTLYITYYNPGSPVDINNVTVVYPSWSAYISGSWVGNQTIQYTPVITISAKGTRTLDGIQFTVPSDGRAVYTAINVIVGANNEYQSYYSVAAVNVISTPMYFAQMVSLMTIIAVLIIVSAIIIAASVFLSARRPQVMWRSEQKE